MKKIELESIVQVFSQLLQGGKATLWAKVFNSKNPRAIEWQKAAHEDNAFYLMASVGEIQTPRRNVPNPRPLKGRWVLFPKVQRISQALGFRPVHEGSDTYGIVVPALTSVQAKEMKSLALGGSYFYWLHKVEQAAKVL